tara:strand:+ start:430 stop:711 length:282 start_codon:yes stop_codon:yes gene_type:complete
MKSGIWEAKVVQIIFKEGYSTLDAIKSAVEEFENTISIWKLFWHALTIYILFFKYMKVHCSLTMLCYFLNHSDLNGRIVTSLPNVKYYDPYTK